MPDRASGVNEGLACRYFPRPNGSPTFACMDLVAAGQKALDACLALWSQRIVDPPRQSIHDPAYDDDRAAIDRLIRTTAGIDWRRCSDLVEAYRHDGDFEWCGAFASAGWRAAGLDQELAQVYFSSTYRLDRYGSEGLAFGTAREKRLVKRCAGASAYLRLDEKSTPADVAAFGARAGDILLVGSKRGKKRYPMGSHVTVVERTRVDENGVLWFDTVEGNATGRLPDGTRAQGVVRQSRRLGLPAAANLDTYYARRLIRPALADLTVRP